MQIKVILGMLLFLSSLKDLKYKKISIFFVLTGGILTLILVIFYGEATFLSSVGGVFTGLLMMGTSRLTRGQIGMGDGMILIITGMGLGFWNNVTILLYGLFFIAIISGILLVSKKISRKDTLPFIPFLFLGYIVMLASNG